MCDLHGAFIGKLVEIYALLVMPPTGVGIMRPGQFCHCAVMARKNATAMFSIDLAGSQPGVVVAPEWVELIPAGPWVEMNDPRRFLNDRPEDVVIAFVSRGQKLPIDYEHATEIKGANGEPARAIGWIERLEVRFGSIWGRVEWTDEGREAIESRSYRYLSPVLRYNSTTLRILEITSAGLTNQPALRLTALFRQSSNPISKKEKVMDLTAICRALGLAPEASSESILAAIEKLNGDVSTAMARAESPSLDNFVPRADHDKVVGERDEAKTALARIETETNDEKITALVDKAVEDGKVTPATRDYHIAQCRADGGIERFNEYVKAAPKVAADSGLGDKDLDKGGDKLTADQKAMCRNMGLGEKSFAETLAQENAA